MVRNSEVRPLASIHDNPLSPLVRLVNAASRLGAPLGLQPAVPDAARLLSAGRKRAGGAAGPAPEVGAAFQRCLSAAGGEAGLTAFGRFGVSRFASRMVDNAIGLEQLLQRHPEIAEEKVERPIFVVGWFRSGTTRLHRLLTDAPGVRMPNAWELYFPIPEPGMEATRDAERRHARMRRMLWLSDQAIPRLQQVHHIEADSAEEATVLLDNAGLGIYFLHAFGAHGLRDALTEQDLHFAYVRMRQQLQAMAWSGGQGRWVLKCPFSMWHLPALFETFPDAQVVHIHRDPAAAVGSVCSLAALLQQSFLRRVDPHGIGAFWSHFYRDGLRRVRAFRADHPDAAVIDVQYARMVEDPVGLVEQLAERLDLDVRTPQASSGPRHGQQHDYALSDFGLSEDGLHALFSD